MKHKFKHGRCTVCGRDQIYEGMMPTLCIKTSPNQVTLEPMTLRAVTAPKPKPTRKLALV